MADEAVRHYGFRLIGVAEPCRVRFHAITAERRLVHPDVVVLTEHAQRHLGCTTRKPQPAPDRHR